MTGDQNDMAARIRAALPDGWFPTTTPGQTTNSPILDGLLAGCAACWAWAYSLLQYAILQTRIATATGVFLDMIASDFFATFILRRAGEGDNALRGRIDKELFRPKATRAAMIQALTDLTGYAPTVFEPSRPADAACYGANAFYGVKPYGSILMPYQCFISVQLPVGSGIPNVMGYSNIARGINGATGGYGVGALAYVDLSQMGGVIGATDVYATINDNRPVCSVAWVNIS